MSRTGWPTTTRSPLLLGADGMTRIGLRHFATELKPPVETSQVGEQEWPAAPSLRQHRPAVLASGNCLRWMWPVQVSIVKLHARLTATHAPNGRAAPVWHVASKARIGITLASRRPQELSSCVTNGIGTFSHPLHLAPPTWGNFRHHALYAGITNVPIPSAENCNPSPLRRGTGKSHICEELIREGGELVYVSTQHPEGLTAPQYRRLISRQPKLRNLQWVTQRRNPQVFVRGKIRHADHKKIVLPDWHQVLMNTETQSVAMRHVAFID